VLLPIRNLKSEIRHGAAGAVRTAVPALLGLILAGCPTSAPRPVPPGPGDARGPSRWEPLAVQQAKAYPETVTGLFVSLADFEDSPRARGDRQVDHFSIEPATGESLRKFVYTITRTGAGAMEVTLAAGAELVFAIPDIHDFTPYTLLSMAVYSESLRDDLRVTLTTDKASWTSHRMLLRPGWNDVLIDIRRLKDAPNFDSKGVRTLRIGLADAAGPVTFNLDDVMLIDNRRTLQPAPSGMKLTKEGMNYALQLPGREAPLTLTQSPDGLWRMGDAQAIVQLAPPSGPLPTGATERLALMGSRVLGQVEVLECNPIRVRLANTWYFPTRAGEWASLAVRQVRWEYTFYADGRWITHLELNNAGGQEIGSVRIIPLAGSVWAGTGAVGELAVRDFIGTVGRWDYLTVVGQAAPETMRQSYLKPGKLRKELAEEEAYAPGDAQKDGFDESQGCYFLAARQNRCRFTLVPPEGGVVDPVFRVAGKFQAGASASSEGLAVRDVVSLEDGSVLLILPGRVVRTTTVEVVGKPFVSRAIAGQSIIP
jgi:hypothetical protein